MIEAIIAAFGMCADGVAEGMYAIRHRFSARAAGFGYAIGAALTWFYGAVTPITFTVESITVATRTAQSRPQIMYIVILSAIPSIILGLSGLYSSFIEVLDEAVIGGIIAGVGIILTEVGVGYVEEKPHTAGLSTAGGVVAYLLTENLVWVIVASVILGTLAERYAPERFRKENGGEENDEEEGDGEGGGDRFGRIKLNPKEWLSRPVLIGAFSLFALRTGAVVSYDTVNSNLAGVEPHLDGVTLMAGLGSLASALMGGGPIETTPAPMAATPDPVFSTALFMALMAAITLFGLVRRVGEYVPLQAIAGFLIVLGIFVILPQQLPQVVENPLPGAAALAITAFSNPFYGILAGEAVALVMGFGIAG
jgi:adenine/guanine/hypoxanthine permease